MTTIKSYEKLKAQKENLKGISAIAFLDSEQSASRKMMKNLENLSRYEKSIKIYYVCVDQEDEDEIEIDDPVAVKSEQQRAQIE